MRFRLADIACGHCVALVLDVAFGHLVAKDYRNQLHRIVCQLCGFINVQIQPAYQPFHFYRRIHCGTGHLHYLFPTMTISLPAKVAEATCSASSTDRGVCSVIVTGCPAAVKLAA